MYKRQVKGNVKDVGNGKGRGKTTDRAKGRDPRGRAHAALGVKDPAAIAASPNDHNKIKGHDYNGKGNSDGKTHDDGNGHALTCPLCGQPLPGEPCELRWHPLGDAPARRIVLV